MADDEIRVYTSSISSNKGLKYRQQRIFNVLDSKKIPYKNIDIACSEDDRNEMRERCGSPTALPPRFFKGEEYLGDYDAFDCAVEEGSLNKFLGLQA